MSTTGTVPAHWLYRVAAHSFDVNRHRAIWSFTWLSTDPPGPDGDTTYALNAQALGLQYPFGFADADNWGTTATFVEQLYPKHKIFAPINTRDHGAFAVMNVNAPEAAFRLQRVGADGRRDICGRITFPIRHDDWFTDAPRRRTVDVARFQPKFNTHFPMFGNSYSYNGRTYRHVVYNRTNNSWFDVTHHVLMPNPVRIWQRRRTYDRSHHHDTDKTFCPHEVPLAT